MFAVYNGPEGIRKMAARTHRLAEIFASAMTSFGYEVTTKSFFDTVTIHAPGRAYALFARAKEKRINLRYVDADHLGISLDQSTRREELKRLLSVFKTDAAERADIDAWTRRRRKPFQNHCCARQLSHHPSSRCIIPKPKC